MIQKFLQGGQQNQQMELLFAALDQQPQEAVQELIKNGVNPEQIMQLTLVGVQLKKIKPESAQVIQNTLQQMVQSAKHGAKLNYIKLLNHKCADDEELFYFKKGGRVGCGCKKKMEEGGKTQLKDMPWKAEFKAKQAKKRAEEAAKRKAAEAARKKAELQRKKEILFADDYNEGNSYVEPNKGVGKNCKGAKMKLHKLGGSLNGIPFMLQGGINPYDARYPLSKRLRASTNSGNNKIYNFFKNIFTSRPAPKNSGMKNVTGSVTSQQTPANALLTNTFIRNDLLRMSDKYTIKPSSLQEKLVINNKSQIKPRIIRNNSQTNFGGVQRGWRNMGQFESVINNLTPQLLMWLDLQGISTENALTLQQGINEYLKSHKDNRRISEDNRWGNQSLSALNEILQNVPNNISLLNIPEEDLIELYPTRREGLEAGSFKRGGLISFMLQGKNLPIAPKAEDRYKNSRRDSVAYWTLTPDEWGRSIKRVTTPDNAKIQREVVFTKGAQNNDTIYTEVPEHNKWKLFPIIKTNIKSRKGFSFAPTPEYEILKQRFNTAWNLAK